MESVDDFPKEYRAWVTAKLRARVHDKPFDPNWVRFAEFLLDVGTAPSEEYVLHLRTKALGYVNGNVVWAPLPPRHGMIRSPDNEREYRIWQGMKQRCLNPRHKDFPNYGGRGVHIEERWLRSFYAFYHDMGPCPDGYSIERKDVNGGYTADNCVWADDDTQRNNKRTTRWVEDNGKQVSLKQYCDEHNMDYRLTHKRLSRGWTIERCTTQ